MQLFRFRFSLAVFSGLSLMAACTEMTDYYPNAKTVEIDGQMFFVAQQPHKGEGVYLAGPNEPELGEVLSVQSIKLPASNVAAIEKVTGCAVMRETVLNNSVGTTYAAVKC